MKREYWNPQAPAFKQSKHKAWMLKACYWQWQMSSRSDYLSISHRATAGKAVNSQLYACIGLGQDYTLSLFECACDTNGLCDVQPC